MTDGTQRGDGSGTKPTVRGPRIAAADRERMIVAAAIRFFADEGFEGQVRELASRMGVQHSVLFRHFATKEALVERVYQDVYLNRWQPEWETRLRDRGETLNDRLLWFYRNYTDAVLGLNGVRIFLFAGLKGVLINARYLDLVRHHVLLPICDELRRAAALPDTTVKPITEAELEFAWGLHGKIFYIGIQKFVLCLPTPLEQDDLIADAIKVFLEGITAGTVPPNEPAEPELPYDLMVDMAAESIGPAPPCSLRRRMRPDERQAAIVAEAITFFAEQGTNGQMRELAKRLGIAHPLLYRYFPTKEALIERVYQEVFPRHWDAAWDRLLSDRNRSLRQRLKTFYGAYFKVIDRRHLVRIFMFAGLNKVDISARYIDRIRRHVIEPIAAELVAVTARLDDGERLDRARAIGIVWGLHGQIMYMGIRRWIYGVPVASPPGPVIDAIITGFFDGAAAAMRRLDEVERHP